MQRMANEKLAFSPDKQDDKERIAMRAASVLMDIKAAREAGELDESPVIQGLFKEYKSVERDWQRIPGSQENLKEAAKKYMRKGAKLDEGLKISSRDARRAEVLGTPVGSLKEVQSYMQISDTFQPYLIAQEMNRNVPSLTLDDLDGGPKQAEALSMVLGQANAAYLLDRLLDPHHPEHAEAVTTIASLKEALRKPFEQAQDVRAAIEEVDASQVEGFIRKGIKDTVKLGVNNPWLGIPALVAVFSIGTYLWKQAKTDGSYVKTALSVGAVGALAALGYKAFSGDRSSLFDLVGYNPDTYVKASSRFEGALGRLVPDQREAAMQMIRIGNLQVGNAIPLYEEALRAEKDEIDVEALIHADDKDDIDSRDRGKLNGKSVKIALEHFFLACASKAGQAGNVQAGMEYAKARYAGPGYLLAMAALDLEHGNANAPAHAVSTTPLESLIASTEDQGTARSITQLMSEYPATRTEKVLALGEGVYQIHGYPFEITSRGEGKDRVLVVKDTVAGTGGEFKTHRFALSGPTLPHDLEILTQIAGARMKERAQAAFGVDPKNVIFNPVENRWETKVQTRGFDGIKIPGKSVPAILSVSPRDERVYLVQAGEIPAVKYLKMDQIQTELENTVGHEVVQKEFGWELGELEFDVTKIENNATDKTTKIEITYGNNKKGTIEWKDGAITAYKLTPDKTLDEAWAGLAKKDIDALMSQREKKTPLESLDHAFEGAFGRMWSDPAYGTLDYVMDKGSQIFGRLFESGDKGRLSNYQYAWTQAVNNQMEEITMLTRLDFYNVYSAQLKPSEFSTERREAIVRLRARLDKLDVTANDIANNNGIITKNVDDYRNAYGEKLDEVNYVSQEYKDLMSYVDDVLMHGGFDGVGAEKYAYAQAARYEVRRMILEMTYPLALLSDAEIAPYRVWIQDLKDKFRPALALAQGRPDGDFSILGLILDSRWNVEGFKKALKDKGIKSLSEANPSGYATALSKISVPTRTT